MKYKSINSVMFVLLMVLLFIPSVFSQSLTQNPTFNLVLKNDTWDGAKIYTVDIYVVSTDVNPIEFATCSFGLTVPTASLNGGTLSTPTWVASTSQFIAGQQPSFLTVSTSGTSKLLRINGKVPPGWGSGTQITLAPGVRMGTMKLTNSVNWVVTGTNVIGLASAAVYPPNMNVYIYNDLVENGGTGTNTDIWPNGTFVENLVGPLLPVELTSFVSNVNGRQVNLSWETKTEVNSNKYDVERSLGSTTTWTTISTLQAAGTSNSPKKYSYTDKNLQSGKYQYRLKMVDNDGSFKYSAVESAEISVPKDFALSQNYPNPFNPTTKINYQVPVDAKVILEVYNITGQKVSELVNQDMSAGYYTADFGSTKLSSGVYIYRMVASDKATGNNFSSIKKMMLLK